MESKVGYSAIPREQSEVPVSLTNLANLSLDRPRD